MFRALLVMLIFSLASCAAVPPERMENQFSEADFAPYMVKGSGRITGQAFVKTLGGDVKFGAGNIVRLVPLTPYILERYQKNVIGGRTLEPPNTNIWKFTKNTVADGNGNFEFKEIPDGEYTVICDIYWQVATPNGLRETGGLAHARVTIKNGSSEKVIVTR